MRNLWVRILLPLSCILFVLYSFLFSKPDFLYSNVKTGPRLTEKFKKRKKEKKNTHTQKSPQQQQKGDSPPVTAGMENLSLIPMGDPAIDLKGTSVEPAKTHCPPATSTNPRDQTIPARSCLVSSTLTLLYLLLYVG